MKPIVTFAHVADSAKAVAKIEKRRLAVEAYQSLAPQGKEAALRETIAHFKRVDPAFAASVRSLRTWAKSYATHGLDGLVEQKRGVVGVKGVAVPPEFVRLGKALAIERGSIAMAARELATHPDLPAEMRMKLHEGHATKSYVTPSIRRALRVAPLTKELIQGERHARMAGRWTPGDYTKCRAGDFFCSDDMTSNVLCWCEWPNALGWRIGQAQILPVLDVRSLRWLNVRVIMRDGGQYNAHDDIWGLFGDVFDSVGLPNTGFVLEGGHWQARAVQGVRTGLDMNTRVGGLESLGLENVRSYDPRSKIIECQFNQFQNYMDRFPGFVGRDQRRDLDEAMKKRIALVSRKNPEHHPRDFFPHISQLADQVRLAMENMNQVRQDGVVLRGLSPLEMWAEHNPKLRAIPDSAKWLYRSDMNVSKVTANGVRVTRGSGPKMQVFYWDAPEHLVPRQGQNVIVHWNSGNTDADAIIRDTHSRAFVCVAKRVHPLARFSATSEELATENQRKKAALHYARTEGRSIQPELVRATVPVPVDESAIYIGEAISQANARAESVEAVKSLPSDNRIPALDNVTAGQAAQSETGQAVRAGGMGVEQPRQIRGVIAGVRTVVESFGGREFTVEQVRGQLPSTLYTRVPNALGHLAGRGEVTRLPGQRRLWQAAGASKQAGVTATAS